MALKMRKKAYCAVYGCLCTGSSEPELSFFKLPVQDDRRSEWLRLISRDDLMNKPPQNYVICEKHFETTDILPSPRRKMLKSNSTPSLHLPDLRKETLTTTVEKSTQTEENITLLFWNIKTQSSKSLSTGSPRKRKLKSDLTECRKKCKINKMEFKTKHYKLNNFHKLCDRFLTKEMADLVKAQTRIKLHSKENV